MEETNTVVSIPQLDVMHYASSAFDYFVSHLPVVVSFAKGSIGFLIMLSFPLAVVFLIGIVISVERLKKIRRLEHNMLYAKVDPGYETAEKAPDENLSNRWRKVLEHVESQNQNDWRQAIMEADIILDEILTKMEYQGDGVGEKLKRVEKADFQTLDQAWEAHRVRNRIAHDGSEHLLSQHEVKRVVHLYKQVFEEFYYI